MIMDCPIKIFNMWKEKSWGEIERGGCLPFSIHYTKIKNIFVQPVSSEQRFLIVVLFFYIFIYFCKQMFQILQSKDL